MGIFYSQYSTEDVIEKSKKVHGTKYDYSKVVYVNSRSKVEIICPLHGSFFQRASDHYASKYGCPECGKIAGKIAAKIAKNVRILSTEDFIKKAKATHGNKYDYSLVEYSTSRTKVKIICAVHGVFEQVPSNHIYQKSDCLECSYIFRAEKLKTPKQEFINDCIKVHGIIYDYSKVEYKGRHNKIIIICKKHGPFKQTAKHHLNGNGCPYCAGMFGGNFKKRKIAGFESFSPKLEEIGLETKRDPKDKDVLNVKCFYCDSWFRPLLYSVKNKCFAITQTDKGECNFYCSDSCKQNCSTYNRQKYPKGFKVDTSREVQSELRKMRFKIDNYQCQVCFANKNLHCHHYEGIEINPIESADIDNCITLCKKCHKELHKIPGYTYQDYKRKECKK